MSLLYPIYFIILMFFCVVKFFYFKKRKYFKIFIILALLPWMPHLVSKTLSVHYCEKSDTFFEKLPTDATYLVDERILEYETISHQRNYIFPLSYDNVYNKKIISLAIKKEYPDLLVGTKIYKPVITTIDKHAKDENPNYEYGVSEEKTKIKFDYEISLERATNMFINIFIDVLDLTIKDIYGKIYLKQRVVIDNFGIPFPNFVDGDGVLYTEREACNFYKKDESFFNKLFK